MLIWKAYKYLFYQNYSWRFRLNGGQKYGWNGYPEQWATVGMVFTFGLYFLAFVMISQFIGFKRPSNLVDMLGDYGCGVMIIGSHFFLFLY